MKCDMYKKWLDRRHDELGGDFEQHMETCAACREEVGSWQGYRDLIRSASDAVVEAAEARGDDNVLILNAMRMKRRLKQQQWLLAATGSIAAAAAAVLTVILAGGTRPSEPGERAAGGHGAIAAQVDESLGSVAEEKSPQTPSKKTSVIEIEGGRIELAAGSVIKTRQDEDDHATRVDLLAGKILAKMEGQAGHELLVTADMLTIRTVVSEMSVTIHKDRTVVVEITEGEAKITGQGLESSVIGKGATARFDPAEGRLQVFAAQAGEKAASALQPQPRKARQPDYTAWKKMIIEGSPDQAAALIENYLKISTGDARALVILGDAKNAGHDYQGARSAYLEAAAADKGPLGANALFKMSVLLEKKIGDLEAAEKGFGSYLSRYPTGSLAEQVRLHLAKILVNTDRPEQAKKHLEILVQTQPGPTRKEAMKLLEKIQ